MTADAMTTDARVSALVADTAVCAASDIMFGADDIEFQNRDRQQAANLPVAVVVEESAIGGINWVWRLIYTTIFALLSFGVAFSMVRFFGTFAYMILTPIYIYAWALYLPNNGNNHDSWWWRRWGWSKVIIIAMQTVLFMLNIW
jgi:hypothetical protein